jgi:hypothetical protein
MSEVRVLLVSEGKHELADCPDGYVANHALPPLAILVQRITGKSGPIRFCCRRGKSIRNMHHGKMSSGWGKKVYSAMWHAANGSDGQAFDAVVMLVDRDGTKNDRRLSDMQQGRNEYGESKFPCALGVAVEAFDAWMIADKQGILAAGGNEAKAHTKPEEPRWPKNEADAIFGTCGGTGLGPKYAMAAKELEIANLETACPKGFKPFADEVRQRIKPLVDEQ